MGNTLLKWNEPLSIYQAQHKLDGWLLVLKWVAVLVFIALSIRKIVRHEYFELFISSFVICIGWAFYRVVATYEIGDLGISYRDGHNRQHHEWSDIEWYYVCPEETTPNMMQVQFSPKAKWLKTPPAFVFDPQEVDTARLRRILEKYLPQKELHGLAMQQQSQQPWA
ncbi:MAG TPA: hypothetical protein VF600_13365 [Abditibacteriaceae bacterium]|jgi:hypothetical protein